MRRSTLLLVLAASAAFVPAAVALAPAPGGTHAVVADCANDGSTALILNGTVAPGCVSDLPGAIGSAPSADTIIACRNIQGCLSGAVNGPGRVNVPNRDTKIQHSQ